MYSDLHCGSSELEWLSEGPVLSEGRTSTQSGSFIIRSLADVLIFDLLENIRRIVGYLETDRLHADTLLIAGLGLGASGSRRLIQ